MGNTCHVPFLSFSLSFKITTDFVKIWKSVKMNTITYFPFSSDYGSSVLLVRTTIIYYYYY